MILVIDNYDSFTYNLVQILQKNHFSLKVIKNDEWSGQRLLDEKNKITGFLISPGPGHPRDAQLSRFVVEQFKKTHPILGICLGHQVIAEAFGARVVPAQKPMHGKLSKIEHQRRGCFSKLDGPIQAVRYHSLIVDPASLPQELEVHAWTYTAGGEKEIMGLRHREWPLEGLQFHPESILSEQGETLVTSFFAEKKSEVL